MKLIGKFMNAVTEEFNEWYKSRFDGMTVVPKVELEASNGKWYGPLGFPSGVKHTGKTKIIGYVFQTRDGITVGKQYDTEAEAKSALHKGIADEAAERAKYGF